MTIAVTAIAVVVGGVVVITLLLRKAMASGRTMSLSEAIDELENEKRRRIARLERMKSDM